MQPFWQPAGQALSGSRPGDGGSAAAFPRYRHARRSRATDHSGRRGAAALRPGAPMAGSLPAFPTGRKNLGLADHPAPSGGRRLVQRRSGRGTEPGLSRGAVRRTKPTAASPAQLCRLHPLAKAAPGGGLLRTGSEILGTHPGGRPATLAPAPRSAARAAPKLSRRRAADHARRANPGGVKGAGRGLRRQPVHDPGRQLRAVLARSGRRRRPAHRHPGGGPQPCACNPATATASGRS